MSACAFLGSDDEEELTRLEGELESLQHSSRSQSPRSLSDTGQITGQSKEWRKEKVSSEEARMRFSALQGGPLSEKPFEPGTFPSSRLVEPPSPPHAIVLQKKESFKLGSFFANIPILGKRNVTNVKDQMQAREGGSSGSRKESQDTGSTFFAHQYDGQDKDESGLESWSVSDAEALLKGFQGHSPAAASEAANRSLSLVKESDDSWDIADAERLLAQPIQLASQSSKQEVKLEVDIKTDDEGSLFVPSYAREVYDFSAVRLPSSHGKRGSMTFPDVLFRDDGERIQFEEEPSNKSVAPPSYLLAREPSFANSNPSFTPRVQSQSRKVSSLLDWAGKESPAGSRPVKSDPEPVVVETRLSSRFLLERDASGGTLAEPPEQALGGHNKRPGQGFGEFGVGHGRPSPTSAHLDSTRSRLQGLASRLEDSSEDIIRKGTGTFTGPKMTLHDLGTASWLRPSATFQKASDVNTPEPKQLNAPPLQTPHSFLRVGQNIMSSSLKAESLKEAPTKQDHAHTSLEQQDHAQTSLERHKLSSRPTSASGEGETSKPKPSRANRRPQPPPRRSDTWTASAQMQPSGRGLEDSGEISPHPPDRGSSGRDPRRYKHKTHNQGQGHVQREAEADSLFSRRKRNFLLKWWLGEVRNVFDVLGSDAEISCLCQSN